MEREPAAELWARLRQAFFLAWETRAVSLCPPVTAALAAIRCRRVQHLSQAALRLRNRGRLRLCLVDFCWGWQWESAFNGDFNKSSEESAGSPGKTGGVA